jgi:nucleotide-binding universal stress UspA family protein
MTTTSRHPAADGRLPVGAVARRVVVGYDGSEESRAALREAVARAAFVHAPLLVVSVAEPVVFALAVHDELEGLAADHALDAMAVAREHLPETAVDRHVATGTPGSVLLQVARPDDLLVVGTRGQGRMGRWLLGSTSVAVASHAPCPVLVVPRDARPDGPVVAGVDGSAGSAQVLVHARAEAAREGRSLRVVSAVPPLPSVLGEDPGAADRERRRLADARRVVADLVQAAGVDSLKSVDVSVEADGAADVLRRQAGMARLLVVGSRGHGQVHALLLGSVSRSVLHQSPCPVLVVRPVPAGVLGLTAQDLVAAG